MTSTEHLCSDARFCSICLPGCPSVFSRVFVDRSIRQGTRVEWSLVPEFADARPYVFRLQVADTVDPTSADWTTVGAPVTDCFYALDSAVRDTGTETYANYRVKLDTGAGTYYSDPTGAAGVLDGRDWIIARELIRQRKLYWRISMGGVPGFLYQRRVAGGPCPRCVDAATGEPTDAECPNCYGTGFACGYYFPVSCVWASLGLKTADPKLDPQAARNTTDVESIPAEMAGIPAPHTQDVWVSSLTDDRYVIRPTHQIAAVRGLSVIVAATLFKLPYSSPLYNLPVPRDDEYGCSTCR